MAQTLHIFSEFSPNPHIIVNLSYKINKKNIISLHTKIPIFALNLTLWKFDTGCKIFSTARETIFDEYSNKLFK